MWLLVLKYGVPLLIQILEKIGFVNWAEKLALKFGYEILKDVEGLKTYSAPSDYPNPPKPFTVSNIR